MAIFVAGTVLGSVIMLPRVLMLIEGKISLWL